MWPGRRNAQACQSVFLAENRMRVPYHLFQIKTVRAEPLLAAMAAVAAGMFVGAWLLGPALTHNNSDVPALAARDRTNFEDMVSRPDPSPYRAATPTFDSRGAPNYATAAKEKAQAELGGQPGDDAMAAATDAAPAYSRPRGNYPAFDRHRVY
jgi:hypothetical protein